MRALVFLRNLGDFARNPANRWRWHIGLWRAWRFRRARAQGRFVDLHFYGRARIRCWPDSSISRLVAYQARLQDFAEMSFLIDYLRPGDGFLDVGANIGTYSVLAGELVGPSGRVFAFEPCARTAIRLRENISLNGFQDRIAVHQVAVGAAPGEVRFVFDDTISHVATVAERGAEEMPTKIVRLDDVANGASFAFGKLDVEGFEWDVLRGAEQLLIRRSPPIWMAETNAALRRYGYERRELVNWMAARGFVVASYDAARRVFRFAPGDECENTFFIADDRRDEIQARVPRARFE